MDKLLRYNSDQIFVSFDKETENLNILEGNRPWELGFTTATKDKILTTDHFYINWPDLNVGKGAAQVTKFYEKEYDVRTRGVAPEEGLRRIESYIYDPKYILVAHNGLGFDFAILKILRAIFGKGPDYSYQSRFIDTNCLARAWKLEATIPKFPSPEFEEFLYKFYNTRFKGVKTNLKALCKEFGIEFDEELAHSASYDSLKTMEVFWQLLWKVEI